MGKVGSFFALVVTVSNISWDWDSLNPAKIIASALLISLVKPLMGASSA